MSIENSSVDCSATARSSSAKARSCWPERLAQHGHAMPRVDVLHRLQILELLEDRPRLVAAAASRQTAAVEAARSQDSSGDMTMPMAYCARASSSRPRVFERLRIERAAELQKRMQFDRLGANRHRLVEFPAARSGRTCPSPRATATADRCGRRAETVSSASSMRPSVAHHGQPEIGGAKRRITVHHLDERVGRV